MSARGESLKSTKDTYVCQRKIFKVDQGHLCLSEENLQSRPRTPMSVRGESLKLTKDTYVCQMRIFKIDQGHLYL
jgi:hypothetical protein